MTVGNDCQAEAFHRATGPLRSKAFTVHTDRLAALAMQVEMTGLRIELNSF
jgi:hypothetical protein